MGNYLLRKGLEYLSDQLGSPTGRKLFDETLMMAPDIAAHDIESNGKGRYIASFSRRVHVYFSKHDAVLTASSAKRFGANRLGRHGPENYGNLPGNVVAIDDKKYANDDAIDGLQDRIGDQVSVHSSHRYHPDILTDAVHVLASVDRHRSLNGGKCCMKALRQACISSWNRAAMETRVFGRKQPCPALPRQGKRVSALL